MYINLSLRHKKKTLTRATTWMHLEDVMLSRVLLGYFGSHLAMLKDYPRHCTQALRGPHRKPGIEPGSAAYNKASTAMLSLWS